jgi:hypothetical protein
VGVVRFVENESDVEVVASFRGEDGFVLPAAT